MYYFPALSSSLFFFSNMCENIDKTPTAIINENHKTYYIFMIRKKNVEYIVRGGIWNDHIHAEAMLMQSLSSSLYHKSSLSEYTIINLRLCVIYVKLSIFHLFNEVYDNMSTVSLQ